MQTSHPYNGQMTNWVKLHPSLPEHCQMVFILCNDNIVYFAQCIHMHELNKIDVKFTGVKFIIYGTSESEKEMGVFAKRFIPDTEVLMYIPLILPQMPKQ